jgi:type II secretory ATPase GspE/PulE/Tfp pilus assembly ATPase PilB-like protein
MSQLPAIVQRQKPLPETAPEPDYSPIIRIQKLIFQEAMALDASDIHIEPGQNFTRVRCRIGGLLKQTLEVPRWMHESLVVRIKILAKLDISERRVPQDGHIHAGGAAEAGEAGDADLRVSTLPTRWGEKIVIRILRRGRSLLTLSQLGFRPAIEERLQALVRQPQGILLVVGPTGSGKTTTLYAFINEIRTEPLNIVTIEDPIEYEVEGISQVQVNERAGLTFSKTLRSILRQDPNVILVGEIRDAETATTAFHAAMTGHLVFSTLHATDSVSALLRLSELGIDRNLMSSAIVGIASQRLVRLNCLACIAPEFPRPIYLERLGIDPAHQAQLRRSAGCPCCNSTGASGRSAVFELLEMDPRVRETLSSASSLVIRNAARNAGFVSITEQTVEMVLAGRVSVWEAYRSCYFGGE